MHILYFLTTQDPRKTFWMNWASNAQSRVKSGNPGASQHTALSGRNGSWNLLLVLRSYNEDWMVRLVDG